MSELLPDFLLSTENREIAGKFKGKSSLSFLDKTLKNMAAFIKTGMVQAYTASGRGLLQYLDARVKVCFLLIFVVIIGLIRHIPGQAVIFGYLFFLFIASNIRLIDVYRKILMLGFVFGFLIAAPASLNVITGGVIVIPVLRLQSGHNWWIYHIPAEIGITREGILVVIRFFFKVTNSVTLTLLIFYTTPFNQIIKSFRMFRVPDTILMVILLTYKFIFVLAETTEDIYLALKSRWWNIGKKSHAGELVAGRIVYLFRKSWMRYEEVYKAMVARGFSGDVILCYPQEFKWQDLFFLVIAACLGIFCYLI